MIGFVRLCGGRTPSTLGYAQITANLAGQVIVNLGVTRNGGTPTVGGVPPPRVLGPFADQAAAMMTQMGQQLLTLQCGRLTSS